jgi:hypothetical protein
MVEKPKVDAPVVFAIILVALAIIFMVAILTI